MLKFLRNRKTAKKVWIILALIIVPAFIFWGAGSVTGSRQGSGAVGRINGRTITVRQFKDAIAAVRNMALMQFGDHYDDVKEYLALESQAWDRLLLVSEAKRRRIRISDREVVETIAKNPYFARKGSFDERKYNEILQFVFQAQPREFEEQTRENLMMAKLFESVTAGITVSDADVRSEYIRVNEACAVDYVSAKPEDFTASVTASEEALQAFYAANPVQFKRPPSYNLKYAELAASADLQGLAQAAAKQIPPEQLARTYGLQFNETGWFFQNEPIPTIGWTPEVILALSRLKIGHMTPPIASGKKFYIFSIEDRKDAFIPKYDEAKDKVKDAYVREEAGKIAREKIEACRRQLTEKGAPLDESAFLNTAKSCGLKTGSTDTFKFGAEIAELGDSKPFWTAASKLQPGEISAVVDILNASYVLRLKKRVPIDEEAFEKEKKEFAEKVLNLRREEAFSSFAEDLKKRNK